LRPTAPAGERLAMNAEDHANEQTIDATDFSHPGGHNVRPNPDRDVGRVDYAEQLFQVRRRIRVLAGHIKEERIPRRSEPRAQRGAEAAARLVPQYGHGRFGRGEPFDDGGLAVRTRVVDDDEFVWPVEAVEFSQPGVGDRFQTGYLIKRRQ